MYGTINVSEQSHILRIIFGLRNFESLSNVKEYPKILNAQELHFFGLIKLLSTTLRQDALHCYLNNAINEFELEKVLNGEVLRF